MGVIQLIIMKSIDFWIIRLSSNYNHKFPDKIKGRGRGEKNEI